MGDMADFINQDYGPSEDDTRDDTSPALRGVKQNKTNKYDAIKCCIVKGCTNKSDQGKFIGDLCYPCHQMLVEGRIGHTVSFLSDLDDRYYCFMAALYALDIDVMKHDIKTAYIRYRKFLKIMKEV